MLTKEQILAMPAGPELDRLTAERVMGWKRLPGYNYWMTSTPAGGFDLHGLIAAWRPSTDMTAAWLVFQECRGRLFSKRRRFYEVLGNLLQGQADGDRTIFVAWPDAIGFLSPRVICQAAILASLEQTP
jgi:hypothetical protein